MLQFSVKTQIDIIIALNNIFASIHKMAQYYLFRQNPNYVSHDELPNILVGYQGVSIKEGFKEIN